MAQRCRELEPLLRNAADRHEVDPGLIAGTIRVESAFRADARSRVSATGLMQVVAGTGGHRGRTSLGDPARSMDMPPANAPLGAWLRS